MTITFGTDGWRAVISDEFTFANVRQVAQAIAEVLLENAGNGHAAADVGRSARWPSSASTPASCPTATPGRSPRCWPPTACASRLAKADAPTPVVSFAIPHARARWAA